MNTHIHILGRSFIAWGSLSSEKKSVSSYAVFEIIETAFEIKSNTSSLMTNPNLVPLHVATKATSMSEIMITLVVY